MDDVLRTPPKMAAPADATIRPPTLLDRYESIADVSRRMVKAAQAEKWEEVAQLEADCILQVRRLKFAAQVQRLAPDDQATRVRLLRAILADDAEIRRLAEPWLNELERLLIPPPRSRD